MLEVLTVAKGFRPFYPTTKKDLDDMTVAEILELRVPIKFTMGRSDTYELIYHTKIDVPHAFYRVISQELFMIDKNESATFCIPIGVDIESRAGKEFIERCEEKCVEYEELRDFCEPDELYHILDDSIMTGLYVTYSFKDWKELLSSYNHETAKTDFEHMLCNVKDYFVNKYPYIFNY